MTAAARAGGQAGEGAGAHRVGGGGGVQHVEVLLPGHVQQVGGEALRQRHHGQAPDLGGLGQEHHSLLEVQLGAPPLAPLPLPAGC